MTMGLPIPQGYELREDFCAGPIIRSFYRGIWPRYIGFLATGMRGLAHARENKLVSSYDTVVFKHMSYENSVSNLCGVARYEY